MNSPWSCNCEHEVAIAGKPPLVEMSGCVPFIVERINLGGTAGDSNPLVPMVLGWEDFLI